MGYDIERFIKESINQEFICDICQRILEESLMIRDCEHFFLLQMYSNLTQTSKTWGQFTSLLANTAHFKLHLSVGGFKGDMSIIYATN